MIISAHVPAETGINAAPVLWQLHHADCSAPAHLSTYLSRAAAATAAVHVISLPACDIVTAAMLQ